MSDTNYRNDDTTEALSGRYRAAITGQEVGRELLEEVRRRIDAAYDHDPNLDPYLEYLAWAQVGLMISNEGRRIGGIDFGKNDKDLEGRKR